MDGVRNDLAPFALLETRALAAAVFDVQLSDRGRDTGCDISCFTRGAGGLSERQTLPADLKRRRPDAVRSEKLYQVYRKPVMMCLAICAACGCVSLADATMAAKLVLESVGLLQAGRRANDGLFAPKSKHHSRRRARRLHVLC